MEHTNSHVQFVLRNTKNAGMILVVYLGSDLK